MQFVNLSLKRKLLWDFHKTAALNQDETDLIDTNSNMTCLLMNTLIKSTLQNYDCRLTMGGPTGSICIRSRQLNKDAEKMQKHDVLDEQEQNDNM